MVRDGRSRIGSLLLAVFLMIAAACSPGGGTDFEPTASVSERGGTAEDEVLAPTSVPASTHLCDHPYFPAVEGASWTYASAGSAVGPYTFTDTATNLREDGFTLQGDFDGLVRIQEWSCSEAGLALLDYSGMGAAQVMAEGLQVQFETTGMTGVTLPADLAPGDEWSQRFEVAGSVTLASGLEASAQGSASASNRAVGFETVSVPAGTFNALRIERTIELDLTLQFGESGTPILINSQEVIWLAEGVGWIKDSITGTIESSPVEETIELVSYSIP
ncbi:MAG: hypothetical protein ACK2T2_16095 [Anaerolineales bacterium]|jgi:hypothetical protein